MSNIHICGSTNIHSCGSTNIHSCGSINTYSLSYLILHYNKRVIFHYTNTYNCYNKRVIFTFCRLNLGELLSKTVTSTPSSTQSMTGTEFLSQYASITKHQAVEDEIRNAVGISPRQAAAAPQASAAPIGGTGQHHRR